MGLQNSTNAATRKDSFGIGPLHNVNANQNRVVISFVRVKSLLPDCLGNLT